MNSKSSPMGEGSFGIVARHRTLVKLAEQVSRNSNSSNISQILWCLLYALIVGLVLLFLLPQFARAGGPLYVAGVSYFDPATTGMPLVWPRGGVSYYTDQGNLSSVLPRQSADALVADAFSQWTSISTAALRQRDLANSPKMSAELMSL